MNDMVKEIYISVDVEADGKIPGDYSMTALGAVVAGYRTTEGELKKFDVTAEENRFYSEIKPISENWNPEAMAVGLFAGFDKEAASNDPTGEQRRAYIMEHGEDPKLAMTRFAVWLEKVKLEHGGAVIFAGYPLGFDWMWTYWYLCKFSDIESPFGHSRHIDIKTLYAEKANTLITRSVKGNIPKKLKSKLPHTHLAIDDAAEQGELLMNILEWEGKKP
jgi:hypothetical protein